MSDHFVSGGTMAAAEGQGPGQEDAGAAREPLKAAGAGGGGVEWETVRRELEEERRRREERRVGGAGAQEQSLYEILQANKAAKQAAFEEQNKLKNQFRPLDDDEVEFLDEVRARERMEEERLRRETEEGLRVFRMRQGRGSRDEGEGGEEQLAGEQREKGGEEEEREDWAAVGGRKRKRGRDLGLRGVRRKMSGEGVRTEGGGAEKKEDEKEKAREQGKDKEMEEKEKEKEIEKDKGTEKKGGLVAYDSDDSDE